VLGSDGAAVRVEEHDVERELHPERVHGTAAREVKRDATRRLA
jgi:hypothetical protein